MEHTCKIVYDPTIAARPWGAFCETCQQMIGACQSQADAEAVGENHARWKALAASFAK